jgi:hypothetical protein
MLPASFQIPAAVILLGGGLLACFAGYRLFRVVLGIFGAIFGALIATTVVGADNVLWLRRGPGRGARGGAHPDLRVFRRRGAHRRRLRRDDRAHLLWTAAVGEPGI